jgi:putative molybdopterin biosynthesis protein
MTRYLDLTTALAERIADGRLAPGTALPSLRDIADAEGTTPTTVRRAYQELADAGAIVVEPRRTAKVAAGGVLAARSMLRGAPPFRLAGSDDPALDLLTASARDAIVGVESTGSYRGLTALWSGRADGSALHLRHRSGEYNAPFARGLVRGREPVLVHLWQREQGLLLPKGNPADVDGIAGVGRLRVARRFHGTGTRALLDRLLLEAGVAPDSLQGPEVSLHLDVAIAVATGEADVGLGLRSAANTLGLDFLPVLSEPFQIATSAQESGGLQPMLSALANPVLRARIAALGGYDLAGSGELLPVAQGD